MEISAKSADETKEAGHKFGKDLRSGDVVLLFGGLGSGKTTFVKGIAKALGVQEEVTSPTFVFSKKYKIDSNFLVHYDCYRITSKDDAEAIGLLEDLTLTENIIIIEWPENIGDIIPENSKNVDFKYVDGNTRRIGINS